ncbi:purple acid phosphatase family protein [Streptomyces sp. NPDC102395]|uniref:purple acid phosphatase family protein n=1 Tax=Streptomyces sp. NPDC102395 TaxID=3366168 RepID=UPI003808158C
METPDVGIPPRLAERMSMAEQYEYLWSAHRRARPSRRRALAGAGALAGSVAGGLLTGCSPASPAPRPTAGEVAGRDVVPFGRHLSFGADPRTRMRVSWQVAAPVRRPFVRLGARPDALGAKAEAEVRPLYTPGVQGVRPAVEQYYVHVALDDLLPGTTYYYGVGHDGFDPAAPEHRASIASFRTAPARPERFVFTAFGDQGVGRGPVAVNRLLARERPAFHLHAGDICYADGAGQGVRSDGYDPLVWDAFWRQSEPVARSTPWLATTGNHDMEAWYSPDGYGGLLARFSLPDSGFAPRTTPGAYCFVYGNVGVVALDANDVSYEIPANLGRTGGRQTAWLRRTLGALRAADEVDFVVVFFHHCAHSTSTHASDGGVRDAWLPLFEQHRVDLVINGHNHVYERTDAVRDGRVGRSVPVGGSADPARDGTVYVTAGGGGRALYGFQAGVAESYEGHVTRHREIDSFRWTRSGERAAETVEWSRVRYRGFSFLAVEAVAGPSPRLTVSARAADGARIDRFEVRRGA